MLGAATTTALEIASISRCAPSARITSRIAAEASRISLTL
jgi:hypothetical protein